MRKPQNQEELNEWLYEQFVENAAAMAFKAGTDAVAERIQWSARAETPKPDDRRELRRAQIDLITAVSRTMQVNAEILNGLSHTFDNGPK